MYVTPTFITEALCLVTSTVLNHYKVKVTSYTMCVYVSSPEAINMDPTWLVKQVLQLYMAAVIDIISRRGLCIDGYRTSQPNI